MHGLWAFLKTPTGAVMGIYGFLVAFWGAGIVLFLGKLINLHNSDKQGLWVEITCQVENALFTITGTHWMPHWSLMNPISRRGTNPLASDRYLPHRANMALQAPHTQASTAAWPSSARRRERPSRSRA